MERLDGGDFVNSLMGGYDAGIITTIYGPAGSGKTTFCMIAAINASADRKVIYVDTEAGLSPERLTQLAQGLPLKNILVLKPHTFEEQIKMIENLKGMVNDKIGLVVVDTISMHYRVEVGRKKAPKDIYGELDLQIAYLAEIARRNRIPVIIANQVYSDFEEKDAVKMVGGDMLKYASKCLIELVKLKSARKAIIRKHRSLPEQELAFEIEEKGLKKINE
jgi:DNA repair protein RadB